MAVELQLEGISNRKMLRREPEREQAQAPPAKIKGHQQHSDATVLPVLNEELITFKAIARDIMHHEASIEEGALFKAEKETRSEGLQALVYLLANRPLQLIAK